MIVVSRQSANKIAIKNVVREILVVKMKLENTYHKNGSKGIIELQNMNN